MLSSIASWVANISSFSAIYYIETARVLVLEGRAGADERAWVMAREGGNEEILQVLGQGEASTGLFLV